MSSLNPEIVEIKGLVCAEHIGIGRVVDGSIFVDLSDIGMQVDLCLWKVSFKLS